MQRRTAVAAASAISMGLVSAVIAVGANFGALGFTTSSSSTPTPQPATATAVQVAAPQAVPAAQPSHEGKREQVEREQGEREHHSAPTAPSEGLEHDD